MGKVTGKTLAKKIAVSGFTLLELIIVIIILGVMAVGIAGFMTLSTQTYLNVTERDELLANARFVIERLNREIRNAVPNSIRIDNNSIMQCIEFVPIAASTTYIDIPVIPEVASTSFTAIRFNDVSGDPYACSACNDQVIVYPLSVDDIYNNHLDSSGKVFNVGSFSHPLPPPSTTDEWTLPIQNGAVRFDDDSPTQRLYIANEQVSYCVVNGQINRYASSIGGSQALPPANPVLMAESLAPIVTSNLPFTILPATLTRNAMVQVNLHFIRDGEDYVFNNDIHINNTP
tara:strand:+ start:18 stop:881 length:864 start_codon:yes stop_codon:yes gene_type:complete